jgi:hypothetical protein
MKARKAALAAAAASVFMTAVGSFALAGVARAEDQIKCEGVNSCKGHGACKSAMNDCKGKNGCAGKGFLMLTPAECAKAKAEAAKAPATK